MQTRAETDDLYAERELLNNRVIALEADLAAAESRERSLHNQLARNSDELLTSLNDLVALANLLRNEEQKSTKLAADGRIAKKGVQERELKLKRSNAVIDALREELETEVQARLDIFAEKKKSDKKLIALRVRYEDAVRESVGYERQLKLTKKRLALSQVNAATAARILERMGTRNLSFPSLTKQSKLFAAIPGPPSRQWQQFCHSLDQEGIFDSKSYLALHPDVAASGADPLLHFLTHGLAEHRALKKDADL